ncbi:hypothetical protein CI109_106648 [Kwoniella shandongensis]|uniref:Uncharacterized protein n=1 Tax=Kwoniella shandongensis TaxID=1734106 RepID=A0AAJ8LQP3_9TREE
MSPHTIIDPYNLTISLLITLAWQLVGFAIAWTLQFDKITDFTGGSNFFILALITLLTGNSELQSLSPVSTAFAEGGGGRPAGALQNDC